MKAETIHTAVLRAAGKSLYAKQLMMELFPTVFEDMKPFCRIGTVLLRKSYPESTYALFKWNGEVRILNVTHNKFFDSVRNLKVSSLADPNQQTLNRAEFKQLIEGVSGGIDDFVPVTAMRSQTFDFADHASYIAELLKQYK